MSIDLIESLPYHLKRCPDCYSVASNVTETAKYKWGRALCCKKCIPNVNWYACVDCCDLKSHHLVHMNSETTLHRHFRSHHKNVVSNDFKEDSAFKIRTEKTTTEINCRSINNTSVSTLSAELFPRRENFRYFSNQNSDNNGISYLIGRSCFNDDSIGQDLDSLDVDINFLIAKLCLNLSRGERDQLSEILRLVTQKFLKDRKSHPLSIHLPQTPSSVRQRFMEGTFAVLPNLPHPDVKTLGEFSFVSLKECVQDLLAHGVSIEKIQQSADDTEENNNNNVVRKVRECKESKALYNRSQSLSEIPDIVISIFVWSDAFEPNTSSKQNRGSVYLKTVSFVRPEFSTANPNAYTYCVAVGPVKSDREVVERKFYEELESFSTTPLPRFFSKEENKVCTVYLEVLCVLQDQPERRKVNYLAYGNSNFHGRWGWSCDFKSLSTVLPSCTVCRKNLLANRPSVSTCDKCLSWRIEKNHPLCKFEAPKKFPLCSSDSGILYPFKLSYSVLENCVEKCHSKIIDGTWNKTTARSFLSFNCLNNESITAIISNAYNCKLISRAEVLGHVDALNEIRNNLPENFCPWKKPSIWAMKNTLQHHIDTIMHLLFLGVTKTLMVDCHTWLTSHNKLSMFQNTTENMYEEVQLLSVSWCKCLPYGSGKFGAHVSENYLACARLMKWYYQGIGMLEEEEVFEEPTTPQHKWTVKVNSNWLRIRGLSTVGNAATLRDRVKEHQSTDQYRTLPISGFLDEVEKLKTTIITWVGLLTRIMHEEMSSCMIDNIERLTKVFLDSYSEFDKVTSSEKLPVWIRHYNFLSLLNLPDIIQRYGPLRNFWEGGICGEAIIASVKPEITMGLRKNWSCSLLKKVMRKKAFESIDSNSSKFPGNKVQNSHLDKSSFRKYSGLAELKYLLDNRKPLSCIIQFNKIYIAFDDKTLKMVSNNFLYFHYLYDINAYYDVSRLNLLSS